MPERSGITPPYRPLQLYAVTEYEVGEIYYIDDDLIAIPNIDQTTDLRKFHRGRRVVIAHNCFLNSDPTWPLIYVAPLSHRVDLMRETDIEVTTNPEDGDGVSINSIPLAICGGSPRLAGKTCPTRGQCKFLGTYPFGIPGLTAIP